MCGIVGVVGKIGVSEEKAFSLMLKLDTVRGKDSTGVIAVNNATKQVSHEKKLGTPYKFLTDSKLFNENGTFKGIPAALIGHNRAATTGKVVEENAHPFDYPSVVGVHNGTLTFDSDELENWYVHDCDSQALYETIDKHGLKKAIGKTTGAWSLAYWDKKAHKVCLLRNTQRPMHYRMSQDRLTVFFASEPWMIEVACEKYKIKLTDKKYETLPNQIYSIHPFEKEEDGSVKFVYETVKTLGKVVTYTHTPTNSAYNETSGAWGAWERNRRRNQSLKTPRKHEHMVKSMFDSKEPVALYFDKKRSSTTTNSLVCFTVMGDVPVKLFISNNNKDRRKIMKMADTECWTATPNNILLLKDQAYLCAQDNSLKGPFEKKDFVTESKPIPHTDYARNQADLLNHMDPLDEYENDEEFLPCYQGNVVHIDDWKKKVAAGCCWCSETNIIPEEAHDIRWVGDETFVCENCQHDPNVINFLKGETYGSC